MVLFLRFVRCSRDWSVSNLEGAEPQIWENLYISRGFLWKSFSSFPFCTRHDCRRGLVAGYHWFFQKPPLQLINLCLRWWGSDCCLVESMCFFWFCLTPTAASLSTFFSCDSLNAFWQLSPYEDIPVDVWSVAMYHPLTIYRVVFTLPSSTWLWKSSPINTNNLFGNPLYWTIFLLHKCIPALIKLGCHGSSSIYFFPLSQVKVGSFCFSAPVRRAGCGGLLVS